MALPAPSTTAEVLLHDIAQSLRELLDREPPARDDIHSEPEEPKRRLRKVRSA